MVVCALFRITGEQMVDKVAVRQDKGKDNFQNMYVDFKQDLRTEGSRQFFLDVVNGKKLSYDGRQLWNVHIIPMSVAAPKPFRAPPIEQDNNATGGGSLLTHSLPTHSLPTELTQDEIKARFKYLCAKYKDKISPKLQELHAELGSLENELGSVLEVKGAKSSKSSKSAEQSAEWNWAEWRPWR